MNTKKKNRTCFLTPIQQMIWLAMLTFAFVLVTSLAQAELNSYVFEQTVSGASFPGASAKDTYTCTSSKITRPAGCSFFEFPFKSQVKINAIRAYVELPYPDVSTVKANLTFQIVITDATGMEFALQRESTTDGDIQQNKEFLKTKKYAIYYHSNLSKLNIQYPITVNVRLYSTTFGQYPVIKSGVSLKIGYTADSYESIPAPKAPLFTTDLSKPTTASINFNVLGHSGTVEEQNFDQVRTKGFIAKVYKKNLAITRSTSIAKAATFDGRFYSTPINKSGLETMKVLTQTIEMDLVEIGAVKPIDYASGHEIMVASGIGIINFPAPGRYSIEIRAVDFAGKQSENATIIEDAQYLILPKPFVEIADCTFNGDSVYSYGSAAMGYYFYPDFNFSIIWSHPAKLTNATYFQGVTYYVGYDVAQPDGSKVFTPYHADMVILGPPHYIPGMLFQNSLSLGAITGWYPAAGPLDLSLKVCSLQVDITGQSEGECTVSSKFTHVNQRGGYPFKMGALYTLPNHVSNYCFPKPPTSSANNCVPSPYNSCVQQ